MGSLRIIITALRLYLNVRKLGETHYSWESAPFPAQDIPDNEKHNILLHLFLLAQCALYFIIILQIKALEGEKLRIIPNQGRPSLKYEISSCLVFEPNKIGKPDVSHEGHLVQYELQEH